MRISCGRGRIGERERIEREGGWERRMREGRRKTRAWRTKKQCKRDVNFTADTKQYDA